MFFSELLFENLLPIISKCSVKNCTIFVSRSKQKRETNSVNARMRNFGPLHFIFNLKGTKAFFYFAMLSPGIDQLSMP